MAEPAVTVTEARKLSFLRADFQIWFGVCMLRVVGDAPCRVAILSDTVRTERGGVTEHSGALFEF